MRRAEFDHMATIVVVFRRAMLCAWYAIVLVAMERPPQLGSLSLALTGPGLIVLLYKIMRVCFGPAATLPPPPPPPPNKNPPLPPPTKR